MTVLSCHLVRLEICNFRQAPGHTAPIQLTMGFSSFSSELGNFSGVRLIEWTRLVGLWIWFDSRLMLGFGQIVWFGSTGSKHMISVGSINLIACMFRHYIGLFGGNTSMVGFPSHGCH